LSGLGLGVYWYKRVDKDEVQVSGEAVAGSKGKSVPKNEKAEVTTRRESPEIKNMIEDVIHKHEDAWIVANRVAKHLGMNTEEFYKVWSNPRSQAEFPDGTCIPIAFADLTYPGDKFFYIVGNDGKPGYFKIETQVKRLKKS
jgi:hypothetical protein